MKKGIKITIFSGIGALIITSVALSAPSFDVLGTGSYSSSCSSIVFGTSEGYSSGTSLYSLSDGSVGNYTLSQTSGSITQKAVSGDLRYPVKVGTGSLSGSFTITFSSSPIIETACVYVGSLSGTVSGTSLSFSSSLGTDFPSQSVLASTQADLTAVGAGDNRFLFSGLDGGNSTPTTSITIGNNGGTKNNNFYVYKIVFRLKNIPSSSSSSSSVPTGSYDNISFHFLELGNGYNGDSIYIKAGDNDILIDAGSLKGSASTIESYLGNYVSDNKLEYVITTHAHKDHISGMIGESSSSEEGGRNGILYHYTVDHLIDFSYYDDGDSLQVDNSLSDVSSYNVSDLYKEYVTARNYAISKGTTWKTAGQIWNSGNEADRLVSLGKGLSMRLLYNFFYDHTSLDVKTLNSSYTKTGFSAQNDDSVCLLFSQGEKDFLFTGDAEKYGESSLISSNSSLGHVDLFKAAHHGSGTANTSDLLSVISPSSIAVQCVAGSTEYTKVPENTFPYQTVIDRIAPYTDDVYVTTQGASSSSYSSLNGNIVFSYDTDGTKSVACSASSSKLKDSAWFASNRATPSAWSAS